MKNRIISIVMVAIMLVSMSTASFATESITAKATTSKVIFDDVEISFEAYNINDNNYFKLRDIAYTASPQVAFSPYYGFKVEWDEALNAINIIKLGDWDNSTYEPVGGEMALGDGTDKLATPCTSAIYLNGEPIELQAYTIGGNNYFKLRDLCAALNYAVDWDEETDSVIVCTYMDQEFYDEVYGSVEF